MIKRSTDLLGGMIVTSEKGVKYVVISDNAGTNYLFDKEGKMLRFDVNEGLTFHNGTRVIAKVEDFGTLPVGDKISEGIKYMYTGRAACAPLTTVYTSEDPRVTEAKKALKALDDKKAELARQQANLQATINRYGR